MPPWILPGRDPLADPEPLVRRVYGYVARRLGDGADAEDVTGEVFERAVRYRGSYDPRKGKPIVWLIGIARRCVDAHSARAVEDLRYPDVDELALAAPGDVEESTGRRLELAAALGLLDERERELVALRYGADLTARQIGELLGMRTNAVEVALHRALRRLREHLEQARTVPGRASVAHR